MIIMDLDEDDGGAGSVSYRINALGSLDNASPYKVIGSRPRKSLDPTWDTFPVDLYHTRPNEREFFTDEGNVMFMSFPKTFETGDVVRVSNLGAGITNLFPGVDYHVIDADPVSTLFKLSQYPDGSPIPVPSGQSGTIVLKMFARGTPLPGELANHNAGTFFLSEVDVDITGGLGGLGLVAAEWLFSAAYRVAARCRRFEARHSFTPSPPRPRESRRPWEPLQAAHHRHPPRGKAA